MQQAAVPGSSVLSTSTCAGEQDLALPHGLCQAREEWQGEENLLPEAWGLGQARKMLLMAVLKACDAQL